MIAVMGGAGHVGSKVADLLLEVSEDVRVLQHEREVTEVVQRGGDVVVGDARNSGDLRTLFSGASAALVLLPENLADPTFVDSRRVMSRAIAEALDASGVGHVVALSAVGAAQVDPPGPPAGLRQFEQDLAALDAANVLVLRSAAYMDYLLAALPMIRTHQMNGSATKPDVAFPMVATHDVAREAADRLRKCDFAGHGSKFLLGPDDVSMEQATRAIGVRLGMPEVAYIELGADAVREALLGAGMSEEVAGLIIEMQLALNDGRYFEGIQRTPESATTTTLEGFLDDALSQAAINVQGSQ